MPDTAWSPAEPLAPTTTEEVQEIVARAATDGSALLPFGGGTGQDYGGLPGRPAQTLDLSGLNRIVAHEHADLTVTVEAGVRLADLQRTLAQHGQFLPLDPPQPERATIGGVLATDASGGLRLGYGTARDWLIGIAVVDASGNVVRGGGKVVKNVTGYDLPKLHLGALGTLGVIVEATFKVAPRPEAARTVVVRLPEEPGPAARFFESLRAVAEPVSLLLHEDAAGRFGVALFHGMTEAVDVGAGRAVALADEAGLGTPGIYPEELAPQSPETPLIARLHGPASDAVALHDAVRAVVGESAIALDTLIGVGSVTIAWDGDSESSREALQQLLALAHSRGVAFSLPHAPDALRGAFSSLWWPEPASLPLQRRLKAALDPQNILNPGRFLGGI